MSYPTTVAFQHQKTSSRLWALLTIFLIKFVVLIPHLVILWLLSYVFMLFAVIGIVVVLINGEYPKSLEKVMIRYMRWNWRVNTYIYCMTDKYPPFTFMKTSYPAELDFKHQKSSSRLLALFTLIPLKMLLLIPHAVVMIIYGIIAAVCQFIAPFAVLILGRMPRWCEEVIVGFMHYGFRVFVYGACLTDEYPPIHWKE